MKLLQEGDTGYYTNDDGSKMRVIIEDVLATQYFVRENKVKGEKTPYEVVFFCYHRDISKGTL